MDFLKKNVIGNSPAVMIVVAVALVLILIGVILLATSQWIPAIAMLGVGGAILYFKNAIL